MTDARESPAPSLSHVDPQSHLVEVFEQLGKRWAGLIIGTLLTGPARFSELAKAIPGISDSVLNDRLRALMGAGLVERQLADGPATTVLYQLTPAGEDFRAAFVELREWSIRNPRPT
jgi:DNA-binding HxlR family transcriptional regulator